MTHPRRWPKLRFSRHLTLPHTPGIYAVMAGREVLYIGLSKDIHQRWNSKGDRRHGRYWLASLRASHIAYLETLDYVRLERRYIDELQPPWNDVSYPWFWSRDSWWLGQLGALGWLLWSKRKPQKRRGWRVAWSVLQMMAGAGAVVGVWVWLVR